MAKKTEQETSRINRIHRQLHMGVYKDFPDFSSFRDPAAAKRAYAIDNWLRYGWALPYDVVPYVEHGFGETTEINGVEYPDKVLRDNGWRPPLGVLRDDRRSDQTLYLIERLRPNVYLIYVDNTVDRDGEVYQIVWVKEEEVKEVKDNIFFFRNRWESKKPGPLRKIWKEFNSAHPDIPWSEADINMLINALRPFINEIKGEN